MKINPAITKDVTLDGITPILFDRYSGDNKVELRVMEKMYVDENGYMVLPSLNIMSFLSAQNTESAPQRVVGRGYKTVAKAALSFVTIEPFDIPFLRDGKPFTVEEANLKTHYAVARVKKSGMTIPMPKERPLLELPWQLKFKITLLETPDLTEPLLQKLFEIGGIAIGFGTFRGVFGKFCIKEWK